MADIVICGRRPQNLDVIRTPLRVGNLPKFYIPVGHNFHEVTDNYLIFEWSLSIPQLRISKLQTDNKDFKLLLNVAFLTFVCLEEVGTFPRYKY